MLAVVTVAAGRHLHLRLQLRGLRASAMRPDCQVVVAMGDPEIAAVVNADVGCMVLEHPLVEGRLPLAAARNAGAAWAVAAGADTLVFLDVDCIPAVHLIDRYARAAAVHPHALLSGPVAYLAPPPTQGYDIGRLADMAQVHPARPALSEGGSQALAYELFWSVSFAIGADAWAMIGGFCERYTGYGAEDTDFAQLARAHGIEHLAVAEAWAFHQWHPSPQPPLAHLHDVVRNANIFFQRWGWWPMTGWLTDFEKLGLANYDIPARRWAVS